LDGIGHVVASGSDFEDLRFKSSGMLRCINQSNWTAQLWRWRHPYHLTCQSLFTCWHSVTSLKTLILISSLFIPCSLLPGWIVEIVVVVLVAVVEVFNAQALLGISITC